MKRTLFILLFAFIILSCRSEYNPVADEDNVQYTGHEQEIQEVFKLVNETRAKAGKSSLKLDEKLKWQRLYVPKKYQLILAILDQMELLGIQWQKMYQIV